MKILTLIILIFGVTLHVSAAIKNLSDSVAQATSKEKKDMGKLLTDISLAPAVDPKTGRNVLQVASIAKGSVYERTGIKVGDLVEIDNTETSSALLKKKSIKK